MTITVPIKRLDPEVELPSYAYPGDAGLDLRSAATLDIAPYERVLIPTGLAIALPDGYAGFVQPRSGMALKRGTDIAMNVASVVLIGNERTDLEAIPKALALSRKTLKLIKENLFWAFIYNVIGIVFASGLLYPFFGWTLNPMIASAAMAFSSVSVVSNSLRLKFIKLPQTV